MTRIKHRFSDNYRLETNTGPEDSHAKGQLCSRRQFILSGALISAIMISPRWGTASEAEQRIKVIFIYPEKGLMEIEAKSMIAGFHLSLDENRASQVEVIRKTFGQSVEELFPEIRNAITDNKINFVVCIDNVEGSQMVIEKLAGSNAIVFVANPSVKLVSGEICQPNTFRAGPNNYVLSEPIAPWAIVNAGLKVFITGDDDQLSNEKADFFAFGFERAGGAFCDRVMLKDSSGSIDHIVASIREADPDFVFAVFVNESASEFLKSANAGGSRNRPMIIGPESLISLDNTAEFQSELSVGVSTLTNVTNPESLRSRIFDKYGSMVLSIPKAAEGYDLAKIVGACSEAGQSEKPDLETLIKLVSNSRFNGARGEFSFDKNHDAVVESWVATWVKESTAFERKIVASLGSSASLDFGCGKVGYPNRPEAAPLENEGIWEENSN